MEETILGIDLGTTNSEVAVIRNGKVEVLGENGELILPSVVGFDNQGRLLVGTPARNQFILAPERTVRSIKRKMGEDVTVRMGEQEFSPQEVSAIILRTLKERAERQLGFRASQGRHHRARVLQRAAARGDARSGRVGRSGGRSHHQRTHGRVAELRGRAGENGALLVYDLGGGTFDVSIVQIERGVVEVLASHGDTHLGGNDFDQLLLDRVCDGFEKEHGIDLRKAPVGKSRVLHAVEEAKKRLSDEAMTAIEEEFIAEKDGVPLHLKMEITRIEYERLIESLLQKTLTCVERGADRHQAQRQPDR